LRPCAKGLVALAWGRPCDPIYFEEKKIVYVGHLLRNLQWFCLDFIIYLSMEG